MTPYGPFENSFFGLGTGQGNTTGTNNTLVGSRADGKAMAELLRASGYRPQETR